MRDEKLITTAASILRAGGVVGFPTETVYGIGANIYDQSAIHRVFKIKGRPSNNPLIVHVASITEANKLVTSVSDKARQLMEAFWPGPLTIVFTSSPSIPQVVTAGLPTVAIRMPAHPIASSLIHLSEVPIAAPSANLSGRPSPTRIEDVLNEIGNDLDMAIDGGPCQIGLESTVIDMSNDIPCILRPGAITTHMLECVIGTVQLLNTPNTNTPFKSPGTNYRHYAPNSLIVPFTPDRWVQTIDQWKNSKKNIGVLCRHAKIDKHLVKFYRHITGSDEDYGKSLFATFLDAEIQNIDVLLVETLEEQGIGVAIMDRIRRAQAGSKNINN